MRQCSAARLFRGFKRNSFPAGDTFRCVGVVAKSPFTARSMRRMWDVMFEALADKHADPRMIARLAAVRISDTIAGG